MAIGSRLGGGFIQASIFSEVMEQALLDRGVTTLSGEKAAGCVRARSFPGLA